MIEQNTVSIVDISSGEVKEITLSQKSPILEQLSIFDQEGKEGFVYVLAYKLNENYFEIVPYVQALN